MTRLLSSVTVLSSLPAFPAVSSPTPQAAQKPGAEKQPAISLTKDGLTINGSRVQLGRTTKADLGKLLGPLARLMHICQRRKVGAELSFSATAKVADRLLGHPSTRRGVQKPLRPRISLVFRESTASVVCTSRA
jgi:hypothetical protein